MNWTLAKNLPRQPETNEKTAFNKKELVKPHTCSSVFICVQVVKIRINKGFLGTVDATVNKSVSRGTDGKTFRHYCLNLLKPRHNTRSQPPFLRGWNIETDKPVKTNKHEVVCNLKITSGKQSLPHSIPKSMLLSFPFSSRVNPKRTDSFGKTARKT